MNGNEKERKLPVRERKIRRCDLHIMPMAHVVSQFESSLSILLIFVPHFALQINTRRAHPAAKSGRLFQDTKTPLRYTGTDESQ